MHDGCPRFFLGTYRHRDPRILDECVKFALERGGIGFDTAPSYGTQHLLFSALMRSGFDRELCFVSDKIDAWQMHESRGLISRYIEPMMNGGIGYYDLLLIHWPVPEYLERTWQSLMELKANRIVRNIGICNARVRHMERLECVGALPDFLQSEIHPLNTNKEMVSYCQENGIGLIAYTPTARLVQEVAEAETVLRLCSKNNRTATQVILRWHIQNGIRPCFMTTRVERIFENTDVLDFALEEEDMAAIDGMNRDCAFFLESFGAPGA